MVVIKSQVLCHLKLYLFDIKLAPRVVDRNISESCFVREEDIFVKSHAEL